MPNVKEVEEKFQQALSKGWEDDAVNLFPQLSEEMRRGYRDKLFDLLRNNGYPVDTPSYAHRINILLPFLEEQQVIYLWNRAVGEKNASDTEREWFGEITLANIAPYLPKHRRSALLDGIDVDTFYFPMAAAKLLLIKSSDFTGAKRAELQKEAWLRGRGYWDSPLKSASDVQGATLEWGANPSDSDQKWLDNFVSKFDPEVVWDLWQSLFLDAVEGRLSLKAHERLKFFGYAQALARVIPQDETLAACGYCLKLVSAHESLAVFALGKTADVIATLMSPQGLSADAL